MKKNLFAFFTVVSFISLFSCSNILSDNKVEISEKAIASDEADYSKAAVSDYDASVFKVYEAEDASYGSLSTGSEDSTGYVKMTGTYDGTISFYITASKATNACLKIRAKGIGSEKTNYIYLNGSEVGTFVTPSESWGDSYIDSITLSAGTNTLVISPFWGWIYVDSIELISTYESESDSDSDSGSSYDSSVYQVYEAESASYGSLSTGYDGSINYVKMTGSDDGTISFYISASVATQATFKIYAKGIGGEKTNRLYVNGSEAGTFVTPAESWGESYIDSISLNAGSNSLVISPFWGWIYVDYIELVNPYDDFGESSSDTGSSSLTYSFVSTPCDANANTDAKKLMAEIAANYGKKIISGQMDLTWEDSVDMDARVYSDTGKHPKLMGYDFLNYLDYQWGSGLSQTEEAISWHNNGGYVTFCWHWRVTGSNGYNNFYTSDNSWDGTDFTIPYSNGSWTQNSDYYQLINDMDTIAQQLKTLQEAGVPVLWRPLHEAAGNVGKYDGGKAWFWWGNSGAEAYKALWKLMYDRFTNYHGLHNLLWVWNGMSKDYYPGDEYVDFVGQDVYGSPRDYSSQYDKFVEGLNFCDNPTSAPKMVALTENSTIPSPSACYSDGAMWAWFMTWNDGTAGEGVYSDSNYWSGEYYNENSHKIEVYSSSYVITR